MSSANECHNTFEFWQLWTSLMIASKYSDDMQFMRVRSDFPVDRRSSINNWLGHSVRRWNSMLFYYQFPAYTDSPLPRKLCRPHTTSSRWPATIAASPWQRSGDVVGRRVYLPGESAPGRGGCRRRTAGRRGRQLFYHDSVSQIQTKTIVISIQ